MKKEYDFDKMKLKRKGPLTKLKGMTPKSAKLVLQEEPNDEFEMIKKQLLNDTDFINKIYKKISKKK